MRDVQIIAKFTTGATCADAELAERLVKEMFLDQLKRTGIANPPGGDNLLFHVEIVSVTSESLFPPKGTTDGESVSTAE